MIWMAASPLRPVSGVVSTEEGGRCPCGATLTSSPSDAGTMGGSAPLAWSGIVTAIGTFKEDMGLLLQCRLRRLLNSASSKDDPKSSASGHGSSHLHAAACVAVVAPRTVWRGVPAPAPAPAPPRTRPRPLERARAPRHLPPFQPSPTPRDTHTPTTTTTTHVRVFEPRRAMREDPWAREVEGHGGAVRGARCAERGARAPSRLPAPHPFESRFGAFPVEPGSKHTLITHRKTQSRPYSIRIFIVSIESA